MASLHQLAWPALLLLGGSGAASHRGQSRDRHFARVFAATVVNAADTDRHAPSVCVAPRGCVLCTWRCGIHCVPRRGGTALLGMHHGSSAHDSGSSAHDSGSSNGFSGVGAAGNGLWSSVRLCALALCSLRHLARSRFDPDAATPCLTRAFACAWLASLGCMLGWSACARISACAALVHLLSETGRTFVHT